MPGLVSRDMKRLNLLSSEIDSAYHEATLKLGLTDSMMIVLYTICLFEGECPLGEIMALSGLPKQTVNSALRRLEAQGALYLRAGEGRKKRVCLTPEGRELCERTAARVIQMENEILASWTPEEREQYLALHQRFLEGLRGKIKEL